MRPLLLSLLLLLPAPAFAQRQAAIDACNADVATFIADSAAAQELLLRTAGHEPGFRGRRQAAIDACNADVATFIADSAAAQELLLRTAGHEPGFRGRRQAAIDACNADVATFIADSAAAQELLLRTAGHEPGFRGRRQAAIDACNADVATFIADSAAAQELLLRTAGHEPGFRGRRYLQLTPSHNTPPAANTPPVAVGRVPHRSRGWDTLQQAGYTLPAQMRCSISVSEYIRGTTPGWFVTARMQDQGTTYRRTFAAVGPERIGTRWEEDTSP